MILFMLFSGDNCVASWRASNLAWYFFKKNAKEKEETLPITAEPGLSKERGLRGLALEQKRNVSVSIGMILKS